MSVLLECQFFLVADAEAEGLELADADGEADFDGLADLEGEADCDGAVVARLPSWFAEATAATASLAAFSAAFVRSSALGALSPARPAPL
jgi:hypothetical protein